MKNFHPQFRRPLLTEPDGCADFGFQRFSVSVFCHKGNASQSQTSEQVGAQTAGVAVSGSQNTSNTGTQIRAGNTTNSLKVNNSADAFVNTGSVVRAASGSTVNYVSGIDPTAAVNAIAQLLGGGTSGAVNTGAPPSATAVVSSPAAPVTPAAAASPVATFFNFTATQLLMLGLAGAGIVYLIFFRKKTP